MVYRPFRSIGRFVLAACAVSFGAASLSAQTCPAQPPPWGPTFRESTHLRAFRILGRTARCSLVGMQFSSVNVGAAGSVAYYFSKYVGGEVVVTAHPNGTNDSMYSFSAGPVFRLPMQNFQLFAHGLVGGARLLGPNSDAPATYFHNGYHVGRWR